MPVTERHAGSGPGAGEWSVDLSPTIPEQELDRFADRWLSHVVVTPVRVDAESMSAATLRGLARYVGVYRRRENRRRTIGGAGLVTWLGDEDGKGPDMFAAQIFEGAGAIDLNAMMNALFPVGGLDVGTIVATGGTVTHTMTSGALPREVLDYMLPQYGEDVEFAVNNDGTVDAGPATDLFAYPPTAIVVRRGTELDLDSVLARDLTFDADAEDFTDKALATYGTSSPVTVAQSREPQRIVFPGGSATQDWFIAYDALNPFQPGSSISVAAWIKPDDWSPSETKVIMGQYNTTGNKRSWVLTLTTAGKLEFTVSDDGTANAGHVHITTSVAASYAKENEALWVAYEGGATDGFFVSRDGVNWRSIAATTSGTASQLDPFNAAEAIRVGGPLTAGSSANRFDGDIYEWRLDLQSGGVLDWPPTSGAGSWVQVYEDGTPGASTITGKLGGPAGTGDTWTHSGGSNLVAGRPVYRNPQGGVTEIARRITDSNSDTAAKALAIAQSQLNRFVDPREVINLSAADYDIGGKIRAGDWVYVYDPEQGLYDLTNEIAFGGRTIHPATTRVWGLTGWPIREGMGVYMLLQEHDGTTTTVDLTDWVIPETGDVTLEVGAASQTLL